MEAIILAGGFGTRLKPLTYTKAKSLIKIVNKPLILHVIEMLPKEVDRIILAVNYKKEQIEEYFEKNKIEKEIIINTEPKPLGTGGAVKFAERYITDHFLVLNSDIICSLNLQDMIKFHTKKNAFATISLWPVKNVSEFGVVEIKKDGEITKFVEKPKPEEAPSNLINAGVYFLETFVFDYIETDKLVSMEKDVFPKIIKEKGKFYGYRFKGYWMDIGRISSYLYANKFLLKMKKLNSILGENCDINGKISECSIGNNVYVGEGSKLKSCILYDKVSIGKNVVLDSCIIGENCSIGDRSILKNVVVGDNECIEAGSILKDKIIWSKPVPRGYPDKQVGNVIPG